MSCLKFNLNNYISNLINLKLKLGNTKLCLVLKSNAYGFGLNNIFKEISNLNLIEYIAITENIEAETIRNYNKYIKIIRIRSATKKEIMNGREFNIEELIDSLDKIKLINELDQSIPVHLSIDMGMNNIGMKINQVNIKELEKLNLMGIMTHFPGIANIKSEDFIKFKELTNKLKKQYFPNIISHVSNTTNFLYHKEKLFFDMVRIGRLQYGMTQNILNILKPTIQWKVNYIAIKNVKKGDTIGYDNNFIAKNNMNILIIPYGYNNGYPILENNIQYASVNNKKCKLVGKVSMNIIQIDITNLKEDIKDIYLLGNGIYLEDLKSNNYYHQGLLLLNIARNNKIIFF
jgi:alanine racemase